MRTLQFAIVFAVTLSMAFTFSPQAFAGTYNCLPSDPHPSTASGIGTPQEGRVVCNDEDVSTWYIPDESNDNEPQPGDPNPRVPIGYDPDAGPWVKLLEVDDIDLLVGAVVPGYTDELREFLIVAEDSPAWSDWHEIIMNQSGEEWIFTNVQVTVSQPNTQVIIQQTPDNEVWIDFIPPLQPLTTVDIIKTLEYVGPQPLSFSGGGEFIEVHQYPTVPPPPRDDPEVGGEFLAIDSAVLILAGAQTNAVWMLSALAVIGSVAFGALYLTSKKD